MDVIWSLELRGCVETPHDPASMCSWHTSIGASTLSRFSVRMYDSTTGYIHHLGPIIPFAGSTSDEKPRKRSQCRQNGRLSSMGLASNRENKPNHANMAVARGDVRGGESRQSNPFEVGVKDRWGTSQLTDETKPTDCFLDAILYCFLNYAESAATVFHSGRMEIGADSRRRIPSEDTDRVGAAQRAVVLGPFGRSPAWLVDCIQHTDFHDLEEVPGGVEARRARSSTPLIPPTSSSMVWA
jgi:hypothetical protein